MDSSISVPPRSLTPQRSASVATSRPIFTQHAWTLRIVRPSARRKTAVCLRFSSRRDLLDAVRAAEQRVERDERQRHELGDPAGALLQLADDAHVLGELPRLLDVAEHHRRGRAQPGAVAGLDDLDPARDRQLVRARSARARRRGGPRRRCPASSRGRRRAAARTPRRAAGRRCRTCARSPSASRRAGGCPAPSSLIDAQPEQVVLERPVGVDARLHADLGRAVVDRLAHAADELARGRARRRRASACPGRSRRTRSRRCRRSRR